MKKIKIIWISIICLNLVILAGLLTSALLMTSSQYEKFYIQPPTTLTKKSIHENDYIHSFLGSPFEQYTLYTSPTKPTKAQDFNDAVFSGDLKNYQNIVNDHYEINLWNNDVDLFQFLVQAKKDLLSLKIEIINESELNNQGLTFTYGLNSYISSTDPAYPNQNIWSPDKLTEYKELHNFPENRIYSFFFKVQYKKMSTLNLSEFQIKTIAKTNDNSDGSYEQLNTIKMNFVDKEYQQLANDYNGLNFSNNDHIFSYFYLRKDLERDPIFKEFSDADWNDETKYVDYIWKNYLTSFYQKMTQNYYSDYYVTFMNNMLLTRGIEDDINKQVNIENLHRSLTWDFNSNEPTLITWHAKKENGKYVFYIPDNEIAAFKQNLENAINAGVKKIFLRGFDIFKEHQNRNRTRNLENILSIKIYDDENQKMVYTSNSAFNDHLIPEFNVAEKDLNRFTKKVVMDLINELPQNNEVTYYWYYDESDPTDFKANMDILNELKAADPNQYNRFKTAYALLYMDIDFNNPAILATDLLYFHHFNFDGLLDSKLYQDFINKREANGLKTSEYTLASSNYQLLGLDPGTNAFWMSWSDFNRLPGMLHYALTLWTENSEWSSDHVSTDTGETIYVYPNLDNPQETFFSLRFQMLDFGYRLSLKQKVISETNPDFAQKYFSDFINVRRTGNQISASKFDFDFFDESKYHDKAIKQSKWLFLNWIYQQQKTSFDMNVKLKLNYWMVNNKFEEEKS